MLELKIMAKLAPENRCVSNVEFVRFGYVSGCIFASCFVVLEARETLGYVNVVDRIKKFIAFQKT